MSIYTLVIIILVRKCVLPANRYRRGAAWDTPATDTRGRREVAERTRPRMAARWKRAIPIAFIMVVLNTFISWCLIHVRALALCTSCGSA